MVKTINSTRSLYKESDGVILCDRGTPEVDDSIQNLGLRDD